MNATKVDRSESEAAPFPLERETMLGLNMLYEPLRLRFRDAPASPEAEDGNEHLYMWSL